MSAWRTLIFCSLFSVILLPEYPNGGTLDQCWLYAKAIFGFRYIDLTIAVLIFPHLVVLACSRAKSLRFPRELKLAGFGFLLCIAVSLFYGARHGGTNLFFDWRGLALGIGLYVVWAMWMQRPDEIPAAARLFGLYMAARIVTLGVLFLLGHRDSLLGVAIPVFDGPTLSCIVFTALLAFSYGDTINQRITRILWHSLALAAGAVVLLCFRRTYWGELAIGLAILLMLRHHHFVRKIAIITALGGCVALAMGRPFLDRAASLDFTQEDGQLSADNSDHVNDLRDAWDEVQLSPLTGIGLGTSYATWHIKNWKAESVMVHNAALHVWLKYGLLGVACYLWFHLALLRRLFRCARPLDSSNASFAQAAFAYITAQFAMTLLFAPWPYSELQLTTLISFILAATFAPRQHAVHGLRYITHDTSFAVGHHSILQ